VFGGDAVANGQAQAGAAVFGGKERGADFVNER